MLAKKIPKTSGLVKKTDYSTKILKDRNKMPSVTSLVTTTALNTKATQIKNKITDNNLATKTALNTEAAEVESKIPDITNLVTKVALCTKAVEDFLVYNKLKTIFFKTISLFHAFIVCFHKDFCIC